MGNFRIKEMRVKETSNGDWLLLVVLKDEVTGREVDWAARWHELANVFKSAFLVEESNLIGRLNRQITKVIAGDTLPLAEAVREVTETLKGMQNTFQEMAQKLPSSDNIEMALKEIGVMIPGMEEIAEKPAEEIQLEHIQSHWDDFVNSVRGEGPGSNLDALLRKSCKPLDLKGNTLTLGFYWKFQKAQVEDPLRSQIVEAKLQKMFNAPLTLRCVMLGRRLSITLTQTGDNEADIARCRDVFDVLRRFPGQDQVHLRLKDSTSITELDVPQITTGYCLELHQQLVALVGEEGLNLI